jgi:hypothetical protein
VPYANRRHLAGLEGPNEQNSEGDKSRNGSGAHDPAENTPDTVDKLFPRTILPFDPVDNLD